MHTSIRFFYALVIFILPFTSESNVSINPAHKQAIEYYGGDWQCAHVRGKSLQIPEHKIHFYLVPSDSLSDFSMPCENIKIISQYGKRDGKIHTGVDIKQKKNAPIFAVFNGIVRMACNYGGYGNTLVIRHANGLESVYAHLSKMQVKVGDHVHFGDTIALAGRTGRASTEHLHFELRYLYNHLNPLVIFDFANKALICNHFIYKRGVFKAKHTPTEPTEIVTTTENIPVP
ncbi:MAG: M23 family metallopeptidase [Bacteroidales bacterium]